MELSALLNSIAPPDEAARNRARNRWNSLAKPLGSLGTLESMVEDIAALTGSSRIDISDRAVLALCADNGVTAQGVTQTDSSVTAAIAKGMARGRTAVCRMAELIRCRVIPVDMGIRDFKGIEGVIDRRVGNGTADFTAGPAMSREQAEAAVRTGIDLVRMERTLGARLLAAGEIGIGNTTTAAAVVSVLLDIPPEEAAGRGAGLSDKGLARKIEAIRKGIAVNCPDPTDPLDVLAKVGGFDLAGMCGLFLGGALYRVPALVDGFPSAAAALCAARLCPAAKCAMLGSHVSAEPAARRTLDALGLRPPVAAGLRLGEGTGAVAAIALLDLALSVYRDAYTFDEGGIPAYTPQDKTDGGADTAETDSADTAEADSADSADTAETVEHLTECGESA